LFHHDLTEYANDHVRLLRTRGDEWRLVKRLSRKRANKALRIPAAVGQITRRVLAFAR
jgi:hypothetical protein